MSHVPDEELISAYLDGEVSEEERAQVERLLAEDPQSRALYEELRALGTNLQGMPRQKLEDDFADSVISRAERAMLSPPHEEDRSAEGRANGNEAAPRRGLNFSRLRRPLIWSGLVVAAALLVMFVNPDGSRDPQHEVLVQGPDNESGVGERAAGRAAERDESLRSLDESNDEIMSKGGAERPGAILSKDGREAPASSSPARPPASGELSDTLGRDVRMRELEAVRDSVDGEGADALRTVPVSFVDPADVMIIRCDVSPAAARDKAFEKLLVEQKIEWEDAGESADLVAQSDPLAEREEERADKRRTEEVAGRRTSEVDGLSLFALRQELVVVEATDDQLEATLATMNSAPDAFLAVEVDPAPQVPAQKTLASQYNRGNLAPLNIPSRESQALRFEAAREDAPRDAEAKDAFAVQAENRPAEPDADGDSSNAFVREQVALSLVEDELNQSKLKRGRYAEGLAQRGRSRARKLPLRSQSGGGGLGGGGGFRRGRVAAEQLAEQAPEKPASAQVHEPDTAKPQRAFADDRAADAQKTPAARGADSEKQATPRSAGSESELRLRQLRRSGRAGGLGANLEAAQEGHKAPPADGLKRAVFVLNVIGPEAESDAKASETKAEGEGGEKPSKGSERDEEGASR